MVIPCPKGPTTFREGTKGDLDRSQPGLALSSSLSHKTRKYSWKARAGHAEYRRTIYLSKQIPTAPVSAISFALIKLRPRCIPCLAALLPNCDVYELASLRYRLYILHNLPPLNIGLLDKIPRRNTAVRSVLNPFSCPSEEWVLEGWP